MDFQDLLEVLDNNLQLEVTVLNDLGDEVYEDKVENLKEEELLQELEVQRFYIENNCKTCVDVRYVCYY